MLEIKNKKTGKNLYPEVLKKADKFFHYEAGYSDVWDMSAAQTHCHHHERQ